MKIPRHKQPFSTATFKKLFATALCFLGGFSVTMAEQIEMASELRSSGKIYVVVACVVLIFAGVIAYLVRLERQLKKLEEQQEKDS